MWHSGTLWFAGGETTYGEDRHRRMSFQRPHGGRFCLLWCEKKHPFGCKTWIKGNVFDVNRSLVGFCWYLFWRSLETSKQQAETFWLN